MRLPERVQAGGAPAQRPGRPLPRPRSGLPHVCFVAPALWPVLSDDPAIPVIGGAEVQQRLLARLFARAGYPVSVVSCDFGQPQPAFAHGITVHKTFRPDAGLPVLRFLHPRLTATWQALTRADADIYYVRAASMLVGVVARFCRRRGRRSVYAAASDADFVPGHRQIRYARDRLLYEHGLRSVDQVVVQNAAQLAACRRHFGRNATLIPSGYEPPPQARLGGGDLVLWVGRVIPGKRAELFLELARRLPARRFALVGGAGDDAAYAERIRREAAALPNVECTGFLPLAATEAWFDRARVLVNTSFYEGMPNTFLQAWARGVPTVATVDVGAPVQQVFAEPAAGAALIERLYTDAAAFAQASRACRAYFEQMHSADAVLAHYARLFEEACPA
ncbi:MAG TPA: glycosyltransferase family 4 protein [Burkholderiales bacterium]|nr:glycosyltransferase family 4 protein [Burkholderiales bacterium]